MINVINKGTLLNFAHHSASATKIKLWLWPIFDFGRFTHCSIIDERNFLLYFPRTLEEWITSLNKP